MENIMSSTITIADLAAELGVAIPEVARRVSVLCRELGPQQVVQAAKSTRTTVLHASAADLIRLDLVAAQ